MGKVQNILLWMWGGCVASVFLVKITKRNKPIATVSAFPKGTPSIFGMFKNQIEIKGDIVAPIEDAWEASK